MPKDNKLDIATQPAIVKDFIHGLIVKISMPIALVRINLNTTTMTQNAITGKEAKAVIAANIFLGEVFVSILSMKVWLIILLVLAAGVQPFCLRGDASCEVLSLQAGAARSRVAR